jgi:hypothetical protein
MADDGRQSLVLGFAGLAPVAVASAMVGLRDVIHNANVALVLVLVVVVAATMGGQAAGATAAVMAAVSFVFFHTRPYQSLTISNADDWETTGLLLAIGLIVGRVAAGARRDRTFAHTEIQRIHRLGALAAQGIGAEQVIEAAQTELIDVLRLQGCRFEPPPFTGQLPRMGRNGSIPTRLHRFQPDGFELPFVGVELPVFGAGRELGRFVLAPLPRAGVSNERRVVAVAIADQVGAVLASGGAGPQR